MVVQEGFRVLEGKREEVEQKRNEKGYPVYPGPLCEASKFLMTQHAKENNWTDNDQRWYDEFENHFVPLVRICKDNKDNKTDIKSERARLFNKIKIKLFQNQQRHKISFYKTIEDLIEDQKISFTGISYRTWNGFLYSQFINKPAFIAYCHVLDLPNWQEFGESRKDVIYSNLERNSENFIVRETEVKKILDLISYHPVITVESLGGFGKTTLVKEAAFRCLQAQARESDDNSLKLPSFDAFIFTSVKQQHQATGFLSCENRESKLEDIYREIARTLEIKKKTINESTLEQLLKKIITKFNKISTLLIIDNLEIEEDEEDIKSLIKKFPSRVKVLITSRRRTNLGYSLPLEVLSKEEARTLIKEKVKEICVSLTNRQSQQIYDATYRIPGAIIYALGQFKACGGIITVLDKLTEPEAEVAQILFAGSLQTLKGKPAYYLLMALVMFSKPAVRDAIAHVALSRADDNTIKDGLQLLEDLLLVKYKNNRYEIDLPLTRTYVFTELKKNCNFEQGARERWINWYLKLSQEYANKDHQEWEEYTYLDYLDAEWDNLKTAIEWCMTENQYSQLLKFWRNIRCPAYNQGASINFPYNRLPWTNKLIEQARKEQDWSILAEVSYDKAWTLTLMEEFADARKFFSKAWKYQNQDQQLQIRLAIDLIYFYWKQQKYSKASLWVKLSKKLLNKFPDLDLDFSKRQNLKILHYEGRIYYEKHDFTKAIDRFF